jgi:hypothetical protein
MVYSDNLRTIYRWRSAQTTIWKINNSWVYNNKQAKRLLAKSCQVERHLLGALWAVYPLLSCSFIWEGWFIDIRDQAVWPSWIISSNCFGWFMSFLRSIIYIY